MKGSDVQTASSGTDALDHTSHVRARQQVDKRMDTGRDRQTRQKDAQTHTLAGTNEGGRAGGHSDARIRVFLSGPLALTDMLCNGHFTLFNDTPNC